MVSLDEAARLLLGDAQGNSHMRKANAAKVRRLYDIANVLSSLNLIEKTHQSNSKKPAFRWLGIKGRHDCGVTVSSTPTAQLGKRLFGKDLTNVDVKRRVVSSVDNGPTKAQISNGVPINVQISNEDPTKAQISLEYPTKAQITNQGLKECSAAAQRQSKASKPFEFGPFCPPIVLRKEVAQVLNFQRLASSLCPSYRNQALRDLFTHYKEAYTSWFAETSRGSNRERV